MADNDVPVVTGIIRHHGSFAFSGRRTQYRNDNDHETNVRWLRRLRVLVLVVSGTVRLLLDERQAAKRRKQAREIWR
jgi:hypothetical protein